MNTNFTKLKMQDAIKTIPTIRASRHKAILKRVNKTE